MTKSKKRPPMGPRVQTNVWLPVKLVKRLKMLAVERRVPATQLVNEALEAFLAGRAA